MTLTRLVCALSALAVAACADPDPGPNPTGPDVVSRIVDVAPGAECGAGGRAVESGSDDDDDGILDDAEVERRDVVCTVAPAPLAIRRGEAPADAACPYGAVLVDSGADVDGDGALDDDEIAATERICHPAPPRAAVRHVSEPAGERCPHGGVAIASGIDTDRDGQLGDTEVVTTDIACNPAAPAVVIARSTDVPAGSTCSHGGTAVHAGIDDDLDGVLADGEIDITTTACNPPPFEVVVRREVLAPAADGCPAGGTAVHSGLDRDRDGILDDEEIEQTTQVCAEDQLVIGDLTIGAGATADEIARYAALRVVTGTLQIDALDVSLPALEQVGGSLNVGGATEHLALPQLQRVGEVLSIYGFELRSLDLGALHIVDELWYAGNWREDLVLPALAEVRGPVMVTGVSGFSAPGLVSAATLELTWLSAVDLPALRSVSGQVMLELDTDSAELPALLEAGSLYVPGTARLDVLQLPALARVTGNVQLEGTQTSVQAPLLATVGGRLNVTESSLVTLSLPALATIRGNLIFAAAPALQTFDLGRLRTVDGYVHIGNLPALTQVAFPRLHTIDHRDDDGRSALVVADTAATAIRLPALSWVGDIEIDNNPDLGEVTLSALTGATSLRVMRTQAALWLRAPSLTSLGGLTLADLPGQLTLEMRSLQRVGRLTVAATSLPDLSAFDEVAVATSVSIEDNPALADISALTAVTELEYLWIVGNPQLTTLDGLGGLGQVQRWMEISNNGALTTLAGLDRLHTVSGWLIISDNPRLGDLSGLAALRTAAGAIEITGNPLVLADEIAAFIARVTP